MTRYKTDKPLPGRRDFDLYPTAARTIRQALDLACRDGFTPSRILEPGAGDGRWGAVARERWPAAHLTGVELRDVPAHPAYDCWLTGAFCDLAGTLPAESDLVMGNPPYRDAEAFVRAGLELLEEGGRLVYLLRWAFAEGQQRRLGLFAEYPPRWMEACAERPSFSGDGKTAHDQYGFFVWEEGWQGGTRTFWTPPLPRDEGDAQRGRPRLYASNADRQAAYRRRQRERRGA